MTLVLLIDQEDPIDLPVDLPEPDFLMLKSRLVLKSKLMFNHRLYSRLNKSEKCKPLINFLIPVLVPLPAFGNHTQTSWP
jgi:hypothetical protein